MSLNLSTFLECFFFFFFKFAHFVHQRMQNPALRNFDLRPTDIIYWQYQTSISTMPVVQQFLIWLRSKSLRIPCSYRFSAWCWALQHQVVLSLMFSQKEISLIINKYVLINKPWKIFIWDYKQKCSLNELPAAAPAFSAVTDCYFTDRTWNAWFLGSSFFLWTFRNLDFWTNLLCICASNIHSLLFLWLFFCFLIAID